MPNLESLLQKSACQHNHLCPRQILGVRMGLYGLRTLGFNAPPPNKRLLILLETDGCFADGIIAATNCTIRHRTLRIEDYGKIAATFTDTQTGTTLRIAARPNCAHCNEEIINQREIYVEGAPLCRFCAQGRYYTLIPPVPQESAPV
ncbi:MAG: hypothetical protein OHK0052_05260 [Anaerolineales bacterium]